MMRSFMCLLLAVAPLAAQEKDLKDLPPGVQPIRLALSSAAAPVPALKYRLLPELRDLKSGNAALLYYRAFAPEWQVQRHNPAVKKALEKWLENSRQMPPKDLEWLHTAAVLKQLDLGARRSHVDWEMVDPLRQEGAFMLLGDIQGFRELMNLLAARARMETADGNFGRAILSLQTGYKLGRDVAEGPTLIQSLVGIAIASRMFEQTEEWIQAPGSPNLYWSLSELPSPFVSLQKPFQGEKIIVDNLLPGIRENLADHTAKPLSEGQVRDILDKVIADWGLLEGSSRGSTNPLVLRLGLATLAARAYPEAKKLLLAQGRKKDDVESMSILQAYLLFEVHNYDRMYDEMIKWVTFPYPDASKGMTEAVGKLRQARMRGSPGTLLASLLLPAAQNVQLASARTERRIAALRIVEAVRLYMAGHSGKFPTTLADIKDVPIPIDPITGGPFRYSIVGERAILFAPPPGIGGSQNTLYYELTRR